jgi:hypothetical protein
MNLHDIPLDQMSTDQLLALRQRIDQHLETLRAKLASEAAALGLVITNGKRKRKARSHSEEHE